MAAEEGQQEAAQEADGNRCEPAYSLIRKLGGYSQVALYVRRYGVRQARAMNRSNVYRWTLCQDNGGTGGQIPAKYWAALIRAGREELNIAVTIEDLSPPLAQELAQTGGQ